MAGRYQVKFYGFTSEDARAFCRDLARVLKTSEEEAWSLLLDAPLVIKDGLDKAQAQRLSEKLVSISALCLVEPMDETVEEEEEPEPPMILPTSAEPELEPVKREVWSFRIWLAVVAVAGTALLIFGSIAYFVSYRDLYPRKKPAAKQPTEATTQNNVAEPGSETSESRAALTERIEVLEGVLKDVRAKAKELDDEINATAGKMGTDPYELRKKQQTLHGYRTEITNAQKELRSLREKLAEMEERE